MMGMMGKGRRNLKEESENLSLSVSVDSAINRKGETSER